MDRKRKYILQCVVFFRSRRHSWLGKAEGRQQHERRRRGIVMTIEKCDENGQQAKWLKWSFRIVMKNYIEHCDGKGHGELWWPGSCSIVMTRSWNIVMTRIMEHCDDTIIEHCDDKNSGALWWQGPAITELPQSPRGGWPHWGCRLWRGPSSESHDSPGDHGPVVSTSNLKTKWKNKEVCAWDHVDVKPGMATLCQSCGWDRKSVV